MARKRMVTRTVTGTQAEVKVVSISANEITTINVMVQPIIKDADKLMKAIKKEVETEDLKVLQVMTTTNIDKMYGMLEKDFIAQAMELNPETRKALETEAAEDGQAPVEAEPEPQPKATEKKNTNRRKGGKK